MFIKDDFCKVERSEAAAVPHSRIERIEKCTDFTLTVSEWMEIYGGVFRRRSGCYLISLSLVLEPES